MRISKRISLLTCICALLICSLCVVNASGSTEADFVSALTTGINADSMWGAVVPVAGIIIFVFLFAFAYSIIRRVLKKGSKGKFGM